MQSEKYFNDPTVVGMYTEFGAASVDCHWKVVLKIDDSI